MENPVPVCLLHPRMDVVTRVAKFGDLLSEELDPAHRVAENDTLVYLQLKYLALAPYSISIYM